MCRGNGWCSTWTLGENRLTYVSRKLWKKVPACRKWIQVCACNFWILNMIICIPCKNYKMIKQQTLHVTVTWCESNPNLWFGRIKWIQSRDVFEKLERNIKIDWRSHLVLYYLHHGVHLERYKFWTLVCWSQGEMSRTSDPAGMHEKWKVSAY